MVSTKGTAHAVLHTIHEVGSAALVIGSSMTMSSAALVFTMMHASL